MRINELKVGTDGGIMVFVKEIISIENFFFFGATDFYFSALKMLLCVHQQVF